MAEPTLSVKIQNDMKGAEDYLRQLGVDSPWILANILRGMGGNLKKTAKRNLPRYFKEYHNIEAHMKTKVNAKKSILYVTNDAVNPNNHVRYPWVLVHGWTIKTPKKIIINKRTLATKVVGGQRYDIRPRAFMGSAFFEYVRSPQYDADLKKYTEKEFKKWQKKNAKGKA